MPALIRTSYTATIAFIAENPDHGRGLETLPMAEIDATLAGFAGDCHAGLTRPSCGRVGELYPRGTEIRNTRQISILSDTELAQIAACIGLEALSPTLLGANLVLEGIPDLSHLPPSSRLVADNGTSLTIDLQNRPCNLPARVIEAAYPGHGAAFKAAARGLRGLTGWVERPGRLALGQNLALFIPDQRAWAGGGAI